MQDSKLNHDAEEYTELVELHSMRQERSGETLETETYAAVKITNEQPQAAHTASSESKQSGMDFAALQAKNKDFIAWIEIAGTKINYPVVLSDNTDYYLTHTFAGKKSKIGTLFSLANTDYKTPGKNISVYGHNISGSGQNMFHPLISYKDESYYKSHPTIKFDTLYHSA